MNRIGGVTAITIDAVEDNKRYDMCTAHAYMRSSICRKCMVNDDTFVSFIMGNLSEIEEQLPMLLPESKVDDETTCEN
jgi:hypothetical protein